MSSSNICYKLSSDKSKNDISLTPKSKKDLQDAMTDKQPGSHIIPKHQSITFKTEVNLTPLTKHRLQKSLTEENAWATPKDCAAGKASWVDRYVKGLHEAFAKGREAESSTCGFSESSDRYSAREGTTRDLRYTLVGFEICVLVVCKLTVYPDTDSGKVWSVGDDV